LLHICPIAISHISHRNEKSTEHSRPGAYKTNEYVIVEAHLVEAHTAAADSRAGPVSVTKADAKSAKSGKLDAKLETVVEEPRGNALLGRILIHTDVRNSRMYKLNASYVLYRC